MQRKQRIDSDEIFEPILCPKFWFIQPILFLVAMMVLFHDPDTVLNIVPNADIWLNKTTTDVVQHIPTDLYSVWTLGRLSMTYNTDTLQKASEIAKWNFTSFSELINLGNLLKDYETRHMSLPAKIYGFLNFVNVLWILLIITIALTIFPVMYVLFKPLVESTVEPLMYITSYIMIVSSLRYNGTNGILIALLGMSLFASALVHTYTLHYQNSNCRTQFYMALSLANIPLAIIYQSKLFGFISVISLYIALGFSAALGRLCYVIGFRDRDAVHRSVATSLLFVLLSLTMKNIGKHPYYLGPFMQPIFIFGIVVYFAALLIASSSIYYATEVYGNRHAEFVITASLFGVINIGALHNIPSLFNIGTTFLTLYLLEKISEMKILGGSLAAYISLLSICMFSTAMFLYTHPDFLMAMFG
jgi:hypothetical protein